VSRQTPELTAVTRRLDFVLKLRRGSEVYLRHLEFEMRFRGDLALRVFEYDAALAARHRLPVVSTVFVLTPPAPSGLVYEERVRARTVCWRRIRVVRLWKARPAAAARLGVGGAALVGLMGRPDIRVLGAAARRISADAPAGQSRDLLAVLRMLSEGRYTARELERVVPSEVVMGSSLIARVKRASWAEGEIAAVRSVCADFARQHHAKAFPRVAARIETCTELPLLRKWALAAPLISDDEFVRLVIEPKPVHSRAPRPARRPRPKRRR
jgi:hypothetical protein